MTVLCRKDRISLFTKYGMKIEEEIYLIAY